MEAKTKRQVLIASSDSVVDKAVKIQGTKFDRKRKISQSTIEKMQYLAKCGLGVSAIAKTCGVSPMMVKYHTDPVWRMIYNLTRSGKHYGAPSDVAERVAYKRKLLKTNASVIYPMA